VKPPLGDVLVSSCMKGQRPAGPSAGNSQVFFEMAHKRQSSSGATYWRGVGRLRSRNTTLLLHDRLAALTKLS
jgi:hypothetical protein